MKLSYKDLLGQELTVGDYVAYSTLLGRSAQTHIGRITALKSREIREGHPLPTIQVKAVAGGWRSFAPLSKVVTLGYLDRVVRINEMQVSEKIKKSIELVGTK